MPELPDLTIYRECLEQRIQTKVQRIRYTKREVDYCPRCQTAGRLLADRALSRLLKKDWPRTIEELEEKLDSGGPDRCPGHG